MNKHDCNLLFVEDDPNIGQTLTERLQEDYAGVTWAATMAAAEQELADQVFDLALLDIGLPDGSGFDIAERIRDMHPETAVVFLTAMGAPDDRIRGLELGAEDYIVKPFHLQELLLRISNVLKRTRRVIEQADSVIEIGLARIDLARYTAETPEESRTLTHKECLLLGLLHERRGEVVSRDEILDRVWPEGEFPSQRTVDNFIVRLRRLVDGEGAQSSVIKSVRSVGYRLDE